MQRSLTNLEESLETLKAKWPKPLPRGIGRLFNAVQKSLRQLKKRMNGHAPAAAAAAKHDHFDFVALIHQLLKTHDLLFLSRQLTYHVVTTAELPGAFGSTDEALSILTELVSVMTKWGRFGSRLEIAVRGINLKDGPALEIKLVCETKPLTELDRQKILEHFYAKNLDNGPEASGLVYAKESLRKVGGQLWLQFPDETRVALAFSWPGFDFTKTKPSAHVTAYKFDITMADYNKIRQRFGIERAKKLVTMVESFVKSMVRYPVDMVMAFPTQGAITIIYESQEGSASSVANRISHRLKKESFKLGRVNATPYFRYQLSPLN